MMDAAVLFFNHPLPGMRAADTSGPAIPEAGSSGDGLSPASSHPGVAEARRITATAVRTPGREGFRCGHGRSPGFSRFPFNTVHDRGRLGEKNPFHGLLDSKNGSFV
jgi:hypothetical protein